jgi:hypothetical protein
MVEGRLYRAVFESEAGPVVKSDQAFRVFPSASRGLRLRSDDASLRSGGQIGERTYWVEGVPWNSGNN